MVRRRGLSIFSKEHRVEIAAIEEPPADLLEQMLEHAGQNVPSESSEMVWTGGGNPIEFQELIQGDLDEVSALDQILLSIIGTHCDFPFPPPPRSADAAQVRHRLEEAKKHLLGRWAKQGPPQEIDRSLLREIARRYWLSYAGTRNDSSLRAIAIDVVVPDSIKRDLSHKDADDFIRSYINAFNREKHKLLLQESAHGLPEFEQRKSAIATIIQRLKLLNLVSADMPHGSKSHY